MTLVLVVVAAAVVLLYVGYKYGARAKAAVEKDVKTEVAAVEAPIKKAL